MMNRAEQNWPNDETIEVVVIDLDSVLSSYVQAVRETGSVFEPLYSEVR